MVPRSPRPQGTGDIYPVAVRGNARHEVTDTDLDSLT